LRAAFLIFCTLPLTGCFFSKKEITPLKYEGAFLGADYQVQFISGPTTPDAQALKAETQKLMEDYALEFSNSSANSFLTSFNKNRSPEPQKVSPWSLELMLTAREVWGASSGAFDPTDAPLRQLWEKGKKNSHRTLSALEVQKLRAVIGLEKIKVNFQDSTWQKLVPDLQIDVSPLSNGHVADLIGKQLESRGVKNYLIRLGSDYVAKGMRGETAWSVAVQRTEKKNDQHVRTSIVLNVEAMAKREDHFIDPRTGQPPQQRTVAVSVVAKTAMEADAWAIAIGVLGPLVLSDGHELSKLLSIKGIKVYLIEEMADGSFREHMNLAMRKSLEKI
jgi:thiamine biosynthesis lipoprotein